jgi:hypothetical protein
MSKRTQPHANCEKKPCQLCKRRQAGETCGSCTAGILIGMNGNQIQRCDVCALFETDDDAVAAVQALGKLLHAVYVRDLPDGYTVADAFDHLEQRVDIVERCDACDDLFTETGPGARSAADPTLCTDCFITGDNEENGGPESEEDRHERREAELADRENDRRENR